MAKKIHYTVTRVPDCDWNNLMETVSLDGSYPEEIKKEVWTAIENMRDFSSPWVVIQVKDDQASATIFNREESARKYIEKINRKIPNEQIFCLPGQYHA